jgi:hypothetical protein
MLTLATYTDRLELMDIQYRLIRFAIGKLSASQRQSFFSHLKAERMSPVQRALDSALGHQENLKDQIPGIISRVERSLRPKYSKKTQRFYFEFLEDGINASELLIRVAHFEAFMKDIHTEVLRSAPCLLGSTNPGRQIKFEKLFIPGRTFNDFLLQEINREVRSVDRESLMFRANYFADHLKLPWCSKDDLELLDQVSDTRNKLSHEQPSLPVSPQFLERASKLMGNIPYCCFTAAKKRYNCF